MQYKSKLSFKIGEVRNFDGYIGEIVTDENIYYFNKNDISGDEKVDNQDYVMFKSKTEEIFPQGYYVKKLNSKKNDKNQGK